jgi:predicted DNA-binding transcriptional regulator AlpA
MRQAPPLHSAVPLQSARAQNNERLNSWKEIAAYAGCGVRTIQRWEKEFGFPVHRIGKGENQGVVFANKNEIDQWLNLRSALLKARLASRSVIAHRQTDSFDTEADRNR